MIAVDEKEEEVGGDSSNDGPKVQVLVHKQRRDREREIANKRRLELGLRNGMLQVFFIWVLTVYSQDLKVL